MSLTTCKHKMDNKNVICVFSKRVVKYIVLKCNQYDNCNGQCLRESCNIQAAIFIGDLRLRSMLTFQLLKQLLK